MRDNCRLRPLADPDAFENGFGFAPKNLFGARRRKRFAYYGGQQTGYGQQQTTTTQDTDGQKQVDHDCKSFTTATYLETVSTNSSTASATGSTEWPPVRLEIRSTITSCSETCGTSTPVVIATVSTGTQTDAANDDVTS